MELTSGHTSPCLAAELALREPVGRASVCSDPGDVQSLFALNGDMSHLGKGDSHLTYVLRILISLFVCA